jgi:hypothetical protein
MSKKDELVTAIVHLRQSWVETTGASAIFASANVASGHGDILRIPVTRWDISDEYFGTFRGLKRKDSEKKDASKWERFFRFPDSPGTNCVSLLNPSRATSFLFQLRVPIFDQHDRRTGLPAVNQESLPVPGDIER